MAKKSVKKSRKKAVKATKKTKVKKSRVKKSKVGTKAKAKAAPKKKTVKRRKPKAKAPTIGDRLAGAYQTVVDTVKGTDTLRNKMEKPGTSETE
jgi:hypothetical protein